jgi:hypothetical protein
MGLVAINLPCTVSLSRSHFSVSGQLTSPGILLHCVPMCVAVEIVTSRAMPSATNRVTHPAGRPSAPTRIGVSNKSNLLVYYLECSYVNESIGSTGNNSCQPEEPNLLGKKSKPHLIHNVSFSMMRCDPSGQPSLYCSTSLSAFHAGAHQDQWSR